jgi:hypothetical protein
MKLGTKPSSNKQYSSRQMQLFRLHEANTGVEKKALSSLVVLVDQFPGGMGEISCLLLLAEVEKEPTDYKTKWELQLKIYAA